MMKYEEILSELKNGGMGIEVILDGESMIFAKRPDNKWIRKCWNARSYLTDEEFAKELSEDFEEIIFL